LTDELALFWPKTKAGAPASNRIAVRRVRIMCPLSSKNTKGFGKRVSFRIVFLQCCDQPQSLAFRIAAPSKCAIELLRWSALRGIFQPILANRRDSDCRCISRGILLFAKYSWRVHNLSHDVKNLQELEPCIAMCNGLSSAACGWQNQ